MSRWHTAAHHTTRTAKLRPRIQAAIDAGADVRCWRCGGPILPGQAFDLGHQVDLAQGGDPNDMRPEHRSKTGRCPGNRSAGGKLGRSMQMKKTRSERRMLPW
jgi:hypothetical protein